MNDRHENRCANTELLNKHLDDQDRDARMLEFFQSDIEPHLLAVEEAISRMKEIAKGYDFDEEIRDSVLEFLPYKKKPFTYIGKTDIEGNKIYADSSIVEFDYKDNVYSYSEKGFFYFDKEELRYYIRMLDECIAFNHHYFKNLKITGNLQENKELL